MALALAGAVGVAAPAARAANVTWTDTDNNAQWNDALNWSGSTTGPGIFDPTTFPTPIPHGASTITLIGNAQTFEVAGSLTFNSNYKLSGGALFLGNSGGPITTTNGVVAEIDSLLTTSMGLTKLGGGTLVLGGANTFTGSDVLSAGTTDISADNNLGNGNNALTIQNGAVLTSTGTFGTFRTVTIGPGGGQINASSLAGSLIFLNGFTADANQFVSAGAGTLELVSASARTGPSVITTGNVLLGNNSALGTGAISVNNGGTLEIATGTFTAPINLGPSGTLSTIGGGATTYNGTAITVAPSTTVQLTTYGSSDTLTLGTATPNVYIGGVGSNTIIGGAGKVILAVANNYAGDWEVDSGTLRLVNPAGLGTGTSSIVLSALTSFIPTLELPGVTLNRGVTMNNGTVLVADNGATTTAPISVASGASVTLSLKTGGTFLLGDSANDLTGGGGGATINVITDTAGNVLRLNQSSDFTGSWVIGQSGVAGAVVEINADSSLGNTANSVTAYSSTLRTTASFSTSRSISLVGGTLDVINGSMLTLSTSLSTGVSAAHKTGNGTLVLAAGIGGSAPLEIDAGTVVERTSIVFGSAINVNAATLQVANATVDNNITLRNAATLLGTGTAQTTGTVSVLAGAAVTIASGATSTDALTLGGGINLTGSGGATTINVSGSGRVVLAQPATYSGGWTVSSGTLQVANATGLGTGAVSVSNGGALELNNGQNSITVGNAVTLNNGGTLRAMGDGSASVNDQFNGTITVAAGATATLTVPFASDNLTIGAAANQITGGAGSTLIATGAGRIIIPFSNNYAGDWQVSGGLTFEISGSASLGTGTTAIPFTGSGTRLVLDDGVSLGRNLTLNNGVTLLSLGTAGVSGTSTVASNAAVTLQAGFTGATLTMGAIAGGGGTSTISTGGTVVILAQDSTYTGAWSVGLGSTLQVDADTRLGAAANPVTLIGTFASTASFSTARVFTPSTFGVATFDTAPGTTLALTTGLGSGSVSLSKSDTGTLILKAASTRTGTTSIGGGVLRIENANALGTAGSGEVDVFTGGVLEIAGVTLNKPVVLLTSTLRGVGTASSVGVNNVQPSSTVTLATGASSSDSLTVGNSANHLTGGSGSSITVSGSGTVLLPLANNYSGDWAVSSGTLHIGNATALGSGTSAVVVNGGALEIAGATLNRPLTLNNGTTLRGTGTSGSNGIVTVATGAAITLATGATTSDTFTLGNSTNHLTGGGSGSTITVSGSGKVILTQSSNYAGNWTIGSGTLAVNGSIAGAVAVNSGATLSGVGSVGGLVTVASGGILSPGNSAGTITVGSLTLNSGAQTNVELGGTTRGSQYDAILSSGNVNLGGTLHVSLINGFAPLAGNSFDILDWGSLSGTFSALQLPNLNNGPLGWDTSQLYTTGVLSVTATLRGDFNRDGHVTAADIPAMLTALTDLNAYASNNSLSPTQLASIGDFDNSGAVTNRDIQGLLDLVASLGGGAVTAVPEPASILLLALALPAFAWVVRRTQLAEKGHCYSPRQG
jgi:fibronectin-binding autotransporter adhesin